jgi:hypothetical protein
MAQPHQYPGVGGVPAVTTTTAYQESYQAQPFDCAGAPWVPGCDNEVTITRVSSRSITDAATPLTISSITASPMPHVEYGRIGDN